MATDDLFHHVNLESDEVYQLHDILNAFQIPYVLFDSKQKLKLMYLTDSLSEQFTFENQSFTELLGDIFKTEQPSSKLISLNNANQLHMKGIPIKESGKLFAVIIVLQITNSELEEYQNMEIDLKTIFDSSYDVLFVADGEGKAIRVSSACERLWGIKRSDFLGRNTNDLERDGVFQPSVTRLVLEQKRKVSVIQKTRTGKTLLVVGTPVMNENGKVVRIINASRDVTEIHQLQDELMETRRLLEHYQNEIQHLKSENQSVLSNKLVYQSEKMQQLIEQVQVIAKYETPVLITGESGVGKEVIASLIHDWSHRSNQPFIKVNCGAIPDSLLESELFGYEKGTFTGANNAGKTGLFLAANNGTILLDEITEMPISLQVKLLRVLQEKEIMPVGSIISKKINVRVVSTTNREIGELIKKGEFREDLYYRLNGIPIEIPPLRKRKEDVTPLVNYFTEAFNNYYGDKKTVSNDSISEIMQSDWKGNIRELKNFVERLLILSQEDIVDKSYVERVLENKQVTFQNFHFEILQDLDLYETLSKVEKQILEYTAKRSNTTIEMARSLGVNQSTISKKLKKYDISLKS
ncbi:sigma-54 interaction domain-containing protein [Alteribacillus sp. JSM 102045]|uniref:sigma-54 interaction domain-containing protein n=1 Tax=Alteribacillus sp. JSM 102045 TaxID=1562101 RepID=UPI0035C17ADB